jgi:hypothetical protein
MTTEKEGALHPDVFSSIRDRLDQMRHKLLEINQFPLTQDEVYRLVCTDAAYEAYAHAALYFRTSHTSWRETEIEFVVVSGSCALKTKVTIDGGGFAPYPGADLPPVDGFRFPIEYEKLRLWVEREYSVRHEHARTRKVVEQLQTYCRNAREVRHVWPSIMSLMLEGHTKVTCMRFGRTGTRRNAAQIALDEMDGRPPTSMPYIPPYLKQPLLDVATWIAAYALIGAEDTAKAASRIAAKLLGTLKFNDASGFEYETP